MSTDVAIRPSRRHATLEEPRRLRRLQAIQDADSAGLAHARLQVRRRDIRWSAVGDRVSTDCEAGPGPGHVTRQSSGRSAVVEFSFDPRTAGPGCSVVG